MLGLFRCGETVSRGVPAAAFTDVNRWPRPDYCQLLFAAGPFDLMANCFERPAVNRNLLAADRPRSATPERPMTQPPSTRRAFICDSRSHRSISLSLNRTRPETRNQESLARVKKETALHGLISSRLTVGNCSSILAVKISV